MVNSLKIPYAQLCICVCYSWVGVCSLCVEYASLCAWLSLAFSACALELIRNRALPCLSTDAPPNYITHEQSTHEQCTYHVYFTDIGGTFAKRACLDVLRQGFMRRACVECSWNTTQYMLVCIDVLDMSVIVNDTCAVHAWLVSNFCPWHPQNWVNFSTHKHAQTQSVHVLCSVYENSLDYAGHFVWRKFMLRRTF